MTSTDSDQYSIVNQSDDDQQPTLLDVLLCCCMPSLRPSRLIYSIFYPSLNTILNYFGIFKVDKMIKRIATHPITKFITIHYVKIISILSYLFISLILSGLGSLFFSLMLLTYYRPPTQFDHPIFFIRNGTLSANVTLLSHDTSKSLVQNGLYIDTFKIKFNLPESNVNREIGMFSIHAEFYDRYNSKLYSTSRSVCVKSLNSESKDFKTILKYKSAMNELINSALSLPFALLGRADESETQSVDMLTETQLLEFNSRILQRASHIHIWLSHENLQIYSSSIQLLAQVKGVWYYLHQYPITSFLILFPISFLSNMSGYLFIGAILFYKFIYNGKSSSNNESSKPQPSNKQQQQLNNSRKKKIRRRIIHTSDDSSTENGDESSDNSSTDKEETLEVNTRIDSPSQSSSTTSGTIKQRQAASNKLKKRGKRVVQELE